MLLDVGIPAQYLQSAGLSRVGGEIYLQSVGLSRVGGEMYLEK
jgi:hypothetical protein